jgi:hypothetical protein
MCTVLLPPGVNPIGINKYIIPGAWFLKKKANRATHVTGLLDLSIVSEPTTIYFEPFVISTDMSV